MEVRVLSCPHQILSRVHSAPETWMQVLPTSGSCMTSSSLSPLICGVDQIKTTRFSFLPLLENVCAGQAVIPALGRHREADL